MGWIDVLRALLALGESGALSDDDDLIELSEAALNLWDAFDETNDDLEEHIEFINRLVEEGRDPTQAEWDAMLSASALATATINAEAARREAAAERDDDDIE